MSLVSLQSESPADGGGFVDAGDALPNTVCQIPWATTEAACQVTVAGVDLAAAIIDCGLRVVVWQLGSSTLLHRILFVPGSS